MSRQQLPPDWNEAAERRRAQLLREAVADGTLDAKYPWRRGPLFIVIAIPICIVYVLSHGLADAVHPLFGWAVLLLWLTGRLSFIGYCFRRNLRR